MGDMINDALTPFFGEIKQNVGKIIVLNESNGWYGFQSDAAHGRISLLVNMSVPFDRDQFNTHCMIRDLGL